MAKPEKARVKYGEIQNIIAGLLRRGIRKHLRINNMKDIALAILCVGLCFYQVARWKMMVDRSTDERLDILAGLIALIAAIIIFCSK